MNERPSWWERRRRRARCFHHDRNVLGVTGPQSFIRSQLIELGARKMFWCEESLGGCGKTWIV